MTIEQLIEEELFTDGRGSGAEQPIQVSVDDETGDFELVTLPDDRTRDAEKVLLSYIH